jgi:hypothetical protein
MITRRFGFVFGTVALSAPVIAVSGNRTTDIPAVELVATLSPVGSSRLAGFVSLKPGKDSTQISATIEIRGGAIDEQRPWQIRSGRCGDNATIEGAVAMYRKLSVRADGTANIRQTLNIPMPNPATHSVTVSQSANDLEVIVACGNLSTK